MGPRGGAGRGQRAHQSGAEVAALPVRVDPGLERRPSQFDRIRMLSAMLVDVLIEPLQRSFHGPLLAPPVLIHERRHALLPVPRLVRPQREPSVHLQPAVL